MIEQPRVTEDDAQVIIDVLNKYNLTEQVSCLLSMVFSHVVAACNNDMTTADGLVQRIFTVMPRQWELTKGLMELDRLPSERPN